MAASLVISCLSQKGGVGKSTMARLIARTYASAGLTVMIADFNTRQGTALYWAQTRAHEAIEPAIDCKPYEQPSALRRENYQVVIADGRPDSDQSSLGIAKASDLVIIPTGLTIDDLKPQLLFGKELVKLGIEKHRILFVLNKTNDSPSLVLEARNILETGTGFAVATIDLTAKLGYQMAQNSGRAVSETKFQTLSERADTLADEIVQRVNSLTEAAA